VLRTLAVLIALLPAVALADMTGQASVIDGDTIEIHGTRIRLFGIHAPESGHLAISTASGGDAGRMPRMSWRI
jgi:endonuclease YncB( thermonuclease family)